MANNQRSFARRLLPTAHKLSLDQQLAPLLAKAHGRVLIVGAGEEDYSNSLPGASFLVSTDIEASYRGCDVLADAHKLPFGDNAFDCVIAIEVFEHLSSPDVAIREIHRVLKFGGHILITVPFLFRVHGDPFDFQRFTAEGLKQLCSALFDIRIYPFGSRLVVISDIVTTAQKWMVILRLINHLLVRIFSGASKDCPSGYVVAGLKQLDSS